ncbi:hypothetical protein ACHAXS_001030 [Conticribra weissflogii]
MCETKIVKTPVNAEKFLFKLLEAYRPKCRKVLELLLEMKRRDFSASGEHEKNGEDIKLDPWDVLYYTQVYKSEYAWVDEAALREFFPLEHVKSAILSIYEEFLEVWHEDVEFYAVRSATCPADHVIDERELFGHFYFDLYPHKGQYSHQCVDLLRPSYIFNTATTTNNGNSQQILPASINISNLTPSLDKDNPSLLLFREVETFFHKCGHIFHCILTKSCHSLHSWAWSAVPWHRGVKQHFLEVPSMMFENFVWCLEILRKLSLNVSYGSCISNNAIDALSKSRFLMTGYLRCKYLARVLYNLKVHSGLGPEYKFDGKMYIAVTLYNVMTKKYTGIALTAVSFVAASWFHLMMGYNTGYYDLFSHFEDFLLENRSVIDCDLGRKYRDAILLPGATLNGNTMIRNFLGRDASNDAFLRRIFNK